MDHSFAEAFLKIMRFEHWLRFYFIDEAEKPMQASADRELNTDNQNLIFHVPQDVLQQTLAEYPQYEKLIKSLTSSPVSLENSREAVFACLGSQFRILPSSSEFEEKMNILSSDSQFRRDMDFFHGWVQALANGEIDLKGNALPKDAPPDDTVPSFTEWNNAFLFWYGMQRPPALQSLTS